MNHSTVVLVGYEEFENLGLRYLAAYLGSRGVTTTLLGMDRRDADEIAMGIRDAEPKIVGFSLIFQRMVRDFGDLIATLRSAGIRCHFTMGGHFPTAEPRRTLEMIPGLDSVVRCEGEETLAELVEKVDRPETWGDIAGLTFRRDGEIVENTARPLIANLDLLPFPDRRGRTWEYRRIVLCAITASRGCYHSCSFCSISHFYGASEGPRRRTRSPASVASEIEQLHRDSGARIFIFEDDDLAMRGRAPREWMGEFLAELERRRLDDQIVWRISCRVDDLDKGMLERMSRAGLLSVYLGIESGNAQGLATCGKGCTVSTVLDAVDLLERIQMPFEFGFMLLHPDVTFATMTEDVLMLKRIGSSGSAIVAFTKMVPYAGTPIARRLERENRLLGDVLAPDYRFLDPRLELMQHFLGIAFHHRNFDNDGSVEMLRHAKFDAMIAQRFSSGRAGDGVYAEGIRTLIVKSNEAATATLSMAVRLMAERTEDEIVRAWPVLDRLAADQLEVDRAIEESARDLAERFR